MTRQVVILSLVVASLTLNSTVLATDRLVPSQYPTIQAGIDAAVNGDVVIIDPNTYTGPGNKNLNFGGKAITVRSIDPNDPAVVAATVIDCQNSGRGFYFHSVEDWNSVVAGLTITNGYAGYGGGIVCYFGSSPTVSHCVITENSSECSGGGIYCHGNGSPTISHCIITNNSAGVGEVLGNGGGIVCCDGSSPTVSYCVITENSSKYRGGGIYCQGNGSPTISHCIITNNSAGFSGPRGDGGGICCRDYSRPKISHCTISCNRSDNKGGGVFFMERCNVIMKHCILWGNVGGPGPEIALYGNFASLTISYSDVKGGYQNAYVFVNCTLDWGEGNIDSDPCFVDPAGDDYHLLWNSPCVDAGDPCYIAAAGETDIDGDPRIVYDHIDIGVDEYSEPPIIIIEISQKDFLFYSYEGGPNPEPQVLSIRNKGIGTLNWQIAKECDWLSAQPNSGSSTGEADYVTLNVDISGLVADTYTCNLTISDTNAQDSPQMVIVNLDLHPYPDELHVPSEYPTIQAAIDAAAFYDTIIVAEGTYTGAGNKNLDFRGKAITVRSVDPQDPCVVAETVIDCQNSGRGFYFHSGEEANSVLAGFTIKRGRVGGNPAKGGGILCSGSSPTIMNCVIAGNQALGSYGDPHGKNAYGGGIYCESNSYLTLINCTVSNNRAQGGHGDDRWCSPMSGCSGGMGNGAGGYGGGIYGSSDSSLMIVDCIISDNSASGGTGGVAFESFEPIAYADGGVAIGGGLYGELAVSNCTIRDNEVLRGSGGGIPHFVSGGGGICCIGSSSIHNCLIVNNNMPDFWGSAVYIRSGGPCQISNCTVSDNTSDYHDTCAVHGNAEITDSIIWGHGGRDVAGCSVTYSCLEQSVSGTGNIHEVPCFVTGPDGDYYLSQIAAGQAVDSPCVDAGSDTAANLGMDIFTTRTDEVGDEDIVDMGYHYSISPGSPDIDGDGDVDFFDYAWFAMGWPYGMLNQIPRGSVVVDGNQGDWPEGVEWRELDKVYWGNPDDVSNARFALQWDDATNKIYAAVIVHDSDHVFLDEYVYWDASDRLEIYSQGNAAGGSGWLGTYDVAQQYYVAPNSTGDGWVTWAYGETIAEDAGLEYAVTVNGDLITYELGVRMFDNYGGFTGQETVITNLSQGHVVGFDLVNCTRWTPDGFGMLSENMMTGKSGNADQFARYVLVEKISLADLDGNGVIDFDDLRILVESWLWGK